MNDINSAISDIEAFKNGYGSMGVYHYYREKLFRGVFERTAEAAQDQLALARLYPDNTDSFGRLIVTLYREELGSCEYDRPLDANR